jgi:diguanylate cyclase (GGDEF)-like protein
MSLFERATSVADTASSIANHSFLFSDANEGTSLPLSSMEFIVTAMDHLPAGLAVFDADLRMIYCNKILRVMLDYPAELFEFGPPSMEQLFRFNAERGEYGVGSAEDFVVCKMALERKREAHTYERRRPNGSVLEVRGVPLENGGFATIYLDVSHYKVAASTPTAEDLGVSDRLTGLPTYKSVQHFIANCQRALKSGDKACVMTIDLCHFTDINNRFGRVVGDFVLREIAIRLSGVTRGTDFLGRTGGDRFTIVHPVILRLSDPARLAGRLVSEIKKPISCGQHQVEVTASVNFILIDSKDRDTENILLRSR